MTISSTKPINIEKNNDLSFSVFIDSQISNTPPTEDFLQNHIYKIYPKNTSEWIDSSKVTKCQSCPSKFSWSK